MTTLLNKIIVAICLFGLSSTVYAASEPRELAPALPAHESDLNDPENGEDAPKPSISVASVDKLSIAGMGPLEDGHGGLSSSIWKGSSKEPANSLLELNHTGIANDTLLSLTTRLLMTQATPPAGVNDDWFLARVNMLVALGQDEKAEQMIATLPSSMITEGLKELHAELLLIRGETNTACALVAAGLENHTAGDQALLFWKKLSIICTAVAGKHDEAMIGLDVLHEQTPHDDLFFHEAIRKIGDKTIVIKSLPKKWSLFDIALLRLSGDSEKLKDKVDSLPPVALKYLAIDNSLDIKLREKFNTRTLQLGITPVKEANKLQEQPFSKPLASDVTTLIASLTAAKPVNDADNAVIARLALDEGASIQDSRRVQRLLTLMEPFGYKVPTSVWQKLFTRKNRFDGEAPASMLIERLHEASLADRKGEVILLSGLIMAEIDADKASDLALLPVIKALKTAGFEKEARGIAVSAVKSYSAH
jgi:hypothetical protein